MVSGVQSSLILQAMRAEQAFKNTVKYSANVNSDFKNNSIDDTQVNQKISADSLQESIKSQSIENENNDVEFNSSLLDYKKDMVNDFKQFIGKIGNFDVNNEDIDYALRYGKSILVDQRA
ncbi:MAG: hypothetical protein PHC34_11455 [Candidatus Gastranaerophilales bacterium]|nr:hypothetical protein [Candidatus Gastranaerophilales bacterium]